MSPEQCIAKKTIRTFWGVLPPLPFPHFTEQQGHPSQGLVQNPVNTLFLCTSHPK